MIAPEETRRLVYAGMAQRKAQEYAEHHDEASSARALRDDAIRKAHAAGTSERELARLTGLSRPQVQRICDLSARKDEER